MIKIKKLYYQIKTSLKYYYFKIKLSEQEILKCYRLTEGKYMSEKTLTKIITRHMLQHSETLLIPNLVKLITHHPSSYEDLETFVEWQENKGLFGEYLKKYLDNSELKRGVHIK